MESKPTCELVGQDGNAFFIIGRVGKTLKRAGLAEKAEEFYARVKTCADYDALLRLAMEYVEVE